MLKELPSLSTKASTIVVAHGSDNCRNICTNKKNQHSVTIAKGPTIQRKPTRR